VDEGNEKPDVVCDRACLDFGDTLLFGDRLI
jgi:hypothetical protein